MTPMTSFADRPPVLLFLALFIGMVSVALLLSAMSPAQGAAGDVAAGPADMRSEIPAANAACAQGEPRCLAIRIRKP